MDKDSRQTITYLRSQPANGVVRWASDHLSAESPWATGWIDVRIPEGGPPGMSWVWTIVRPGDPQQPKPGELWYFEWPHDLAVHGVFDPSEGWYVHELPIPADFVLPRSLAAAYEKYGLRVEGSYEVRGGWSARAVCDALAAWAARHAGREDLRFEWDPEAGVSPILSRVMERAAAGGPVWVLGDGLRVVDGVLDDLLTLHPDEATEITSFFGKPTGDSSATPSDGKSLEGRPCLATTGRYATKTEEEREGPVAGPGAVVRCP